MSRNESNPRIVPSSSSGVSSSTASNKTSNNNASYQVPAYLHFVPGGILYDEIKDSEYEYYLSGNLNPKILINKALEADDELNMLANVMKYSETTSKVPLRYPSLSILAETVCDSLMGVAASNIRTWFDQMILSASSKEHSSSKSLLQYLSSLSLPTCRPCKPRPCGYVFRRGDIAWNCRTCQTDGTCVICDECFRASDHEGHDVYFHKTSPGGCCDCGDIEAWKVEGCCPKHRPQVSNCGSGSGDDVMEAVKASRTGRVEGEQAVRELPKKVAAVLGVVVGAAVQCILEAMDCSGIGSDSDQWHVRWREQVLQIQNLIGRQEDWYYNNNKFRYISVKEFISKENHVFQNLPPGFRLHLRLHNDDVHTFEEVIEALHEPIPLPNDNDHTNEEMTMTDSNNPANSNQPLQQQIRLVPLKEDADDMTHHVDSDGQVTVRLYTSFQDAMVGFQRLKSRGLHCSVVSTPQFDLEMRAKVLLTWLKDISASHPAVSAIVIHALCDVTNGRDTFGDTEIWLQPRIIPVWAGMKDQSMRISAFPPYLDSSYITRDEAKRLYKLGMGNANNFNTSSAFQLKVGCVDGFYNSYPLFFPSRKLRKSPHSLWGTLSISSDQHFHPILQSDKSNSQNIYDLSDQYIIVDTDLRKQQEAFRITSSLHPYKIAGLSMISGVGFADAHPPSKYALTAQLYAASFRAPASALLLFLLLDPYPPKQLRASLHALFLSLLIDPRFRSRFAASLGGVAYRPLSTLFCAGVGTEADTPLGFTVQIFTAGSLVRALNSPKATNALLQCDDFDNHTKIISEDITYSPSIFTMPIALSIVRIVHTNLLGATKEVKMVVKNTSASSAPALTYQPGEHPLSTLLPAAPDDGFLESRTTRHKRIPHLLRDLEFVLMTPGTAIKLVSGLDLPLSPPLIDIHSGIHPSSSNVLDFATVWSRMLRLGMGMDPQKRKTSGGHVEYEQNRWVEAFGLVLNFAGTRDVLMAGVSSSVLDDKVSLAIGNILKALLREMKLWLFREGLLETGFPMPVVQQNQSGMLEPFQRSTLHWNAPSASAVGSSISVGSGFNNVALSCATGVKMTETQLDLMEYSLKCEEEDYQEKQKCRMKENLASSTYGNFTSCRGVLLGDWLRVPHSPIHGETLTFYLPLYRAFARCLKSYCSIVVTNNIRTANPRGWWKIPAIDDFDSELTSDGSAISAEMAIARNPIATLLRSSLRSSNCRVVWSSGPDCTPAQAHARRTRCRSIAAALASAKVVHSLCDHPLRCLAASQQIERHLWNRNGGAAQGMAFNYASSPICCTFRDLDLTLIQLSASGFCIGLGPRRTLGLILSRFNMDGYLCDPIRRNGNASPSLASTSMNSGGWVQLPRLDEDHPVALAEAFFTTICLIVTELPGPPPLSPDDDSGMRRTMRRELLHALAAEPKSYSEALAAASVDYQRKEKNESFRQVFSSILKDIGKEKRGAQSQISRAGPPTYELSAACSDEYDPTFFHLKRVEHQHAMDTIARLRKQKLNNQGKKTQKCLPLVLAPPPTHPRFLSCRLILHLPAMDAALRRALLFALLAGSWLPPPEPVKSYPDDGSAIGASASGDSDGGLSRKSASSTKVRRGFHRSMSSSFQKNKSGGNNPSTYLPFSPAVVASSSVSFLEVLQVLTLQVHTLEECASLHQTHDMEEESRHLSSSLSINSYLSRLIHVPCTLEDCWALSCPDPLPSAGTGAHRGSILGLLIALYEHRNDHGAASSSHEDEGSGGARTLTSDGLKWLLRFVGALVDAAPTVSSACHSATSGTPIRGNVVTTTWTISPSIRAAIKGMLSNLPDLWPKEQSNKDMLSGTKSSGGDSSTKSKANLEARKAAQLRAMEMMRKQQASFAASIEAMASLDGEDKKYGDSPAASFDDLEADDSTEDEDICIICRCGDTDGDNNGPLGFLGHVQRSRVLQLRNGAEVGGSNENFVMAARVVGDKGCQLRVSEDLDSSPIACLPEGSIVMILESKVSSKYDLLSRRVLVRHVSASDPPKTTEGWASIQSSQGYVILSPLSKLCYNYSRWGSTRPLIRTCGHAAHLGCVDAHCLSLHNRASNDQPYDGRFAANIEEGEFLCPLCKQLSNVLVPKGLNTGLSNRGVFKKTCPIISLNDSEEASLEGKDSASNNITSLKKIIVEGMQMSFDDYFSMGPKVSSAMSKQTKEREALRRYGGQLFEAMQASWEKSSSQKLRPNKWHPALEKWDFEDKDVDSSMTDQGENKPTVGKFLRLLRQQHIAWAAVGFGASAAESSARGTFQSSETSLQASNPTIVTDPWSGYDTQSRDNHPMVLELRRIVTATSSLLDVLNLEMMEQLTPVEDCSDSTLRGASLIGELLGNIIEGKSYLEIGLMEIKEEWRTLIAFISSMPCHVSRDGCLPYRHEARSTAAAMWASKGIGVPASNTPKSPSASPSLSNDGSRRKKNKIEDGQDSTPPTPLAVKEICERKKHENEHYKRSPMLFNDWGTMDPIEAVQNEHKPFRPAVASSFLYVPLLAWDLNTFAGALFSSLLIGNDIDNVLRSEDLLLASQVLMTARLMQILITPYGVPLDKGNNCLLQNEIGFWNVKKMEKEGESLRELQKFSLLALNRLDSRAYDESINGPDFLHNVSLAILPFARSIILMLRACASVVRQRQKQMRRCKKLSSSKPSPNERKLDSVLENSNIMCSSDGLYIMSLLGCPMPSSLLQPDDNDINWINVTKNWLKALVVLEDHHGSRGRGFVFDNSVDRWVPSFAVGKDFPLADAAEEEKSKSPPKTSLEVLADAVTKLDSSSTLAEGQKKEPQSNLMKNSFEGRSSNIDSGWHSSSNDAYDAEIEDAGDDEMEIVADNDDDVDDVDDVDVDVEMEEAAEESVFNVHQGAFEGRLFDLLQNQAIIANDQIESEDEAEMSDEDEVIVMDATLNNDDDDDDDETDEGNMILGTGGRRVNISGELQYHGISDEDSSISSSSLDKEDEGSGRAEVDFCSLSRASVIPYQPSLIGHSIGPGPRGVFFEYKLANAVMSDLSHLGMVHRNDGFNSGLVRLPSSFVELYSLVNKVKGRDSGYNGDDPDDGSNAETAICLITGAIMRSGSSRRPFARGQARPPGACTVHARKFGSGIGVFFLLTKCTVLLIHNNKSAYSASLYVDEHGEEDPGLRRGRPLFLRQARYAALETLWRQHGIPREIAQIRSTSDRVIRDNWY